METKHTPGPWKVFETRHPYELTTHDRELRGEHIERRIGTAWDHPQLKGPAGVVNLTSGVGEKGSGGVRFISIKESDAHLIAAAPDLLAALKGARDWLSSFSMPPTSTIAEKQEQLDRIDAAIAKAEGL